ncbi:MAG: DUF3864 domain-containing protein [Pirellula sp.]
MVQQSTFALFSRIKFRLVSCSACALVAMAFSSITAAHPTYDQTWTEPAAELATEPATAQREAPDSAIRGEQLLGQRFLTLNTVVRVRQIEVTRDVAHGPDESSIHTPAEARTFFTRYDLPASEPADPGPGQQTRNWSLMNRINQKGTRPQDVPVAISELADEDRALIRRHYPELVPIDAK